MPIIPFYVIPCELTIIILIGFRFQPFKLHLYSLTTNPHFLMNIECVHIYKDKYQTPTE